MYVRVLVFSVFVFLMVCVAAGCQKANEKATSADAASADKPAVEQASVDSAAPVVLTAPLDDSTRADPARLYAALCARCHGLDGVPVFEGAPNLKELTCPKRAITGTIYSGRGQMPSFGKVLTRPEISRLADYVRAMQENG